MALPEVMAELFVAAGEALVGSAGPRRAEALKRRAEAQVAYLRWRELE